jgi:hypothetical protein
MTHEGRPFFQHARALEIRSTGAILARLDQALTPGDIIGIQFGQKKARCRVISSQEHGALEKNRAEIQLLDGQECPWFEELTKEEVMADTEKSRRRRKRHRIFFNLDLCDERVKTPIKVRATDISANGCYVETMLPLQVGTILRIDFWLDTEKVSTTGIVRTNDPGVGMGIEFTGLTQDIQNRLQSLLDGIDVNASSVLKPEHATE